MKVLVADTLSEEGINMLRDHVEVDVRTGLTPEELLSIIGGYEGLIVRSQTQVTAEVIQEGKELQVIARAGVGVDNIDIDEATRQGIMVVNAPTGNTVSAAEHTIALMLALARSIPQANTMLKSGVWNRSDFMGIEIRGKALGIVGLGNVGTEVARRARGLEMRLIGYDPFVSVEHAAKLQVEVVSFEQLLKESDFITLHVPLTQSTRGLIGTKALTQVKSTVRIINSARGGLIDEQALVNAVKDKRVAGAAVDVFPKEPTTESMLFECDEIIVTPHLGASTSEAQTLAAKMVAEQIIDISKGQPPRYAINAPFIPAETISVLSPFIKTASILGRLVSQLVEGQMETIQIEYEGDISNYDTSALKATVLRELLGGVSEERINMVNADVVAARRGLNVVEQKESVCENYASLITLQVTTSAGVTTVSGAVLHGEPHIVRVNEYWLDIVPTENYFLFSDHLDRPGMISAVSRITGESDVNVSAMVLGRLKPRGMALMILALDESLTDEQLQQVRAVPDVYTAKLIKL